jgi:glycosyltransferase involved in cell wall biosynthesis
MSRVELSIVVPVFNEEMSVAPLVESVRSALGDSCDWELIVVDDGSRDGTVSRALEAAASDSRIRLLRLARNYGQTPAMQAGFDQARGKVVVSMDGDLQNDPRDIPILVSKLNEGYDLVAGYRVKRQDRLLTRKVPSWVANRIIQNLTGVPIRDNGCSLKAYRKELLNRVHLYSDMHRFIPAVAAATGGARITEVPVRHHARQHGKSKYGLSRIFKVLSDLLVIKMIRSFRERPLLLFSSGALLAGLLAVPFGAASIVASFAFGPEKADAVIFPAATAILVGLAAYLLMLGLLAETALRHGSLKETKQSALRSSGGSVSPTSAR